MNMTVPQAAALIKQIGEIIKMTGGGETSGGMTRRVFGRSR